MSEIFSAVPIIDKLYDFQRGTVEHAFERLYLAPDSSRRFLVADETGLGKTHVAKGVIAKTIEHLQHRDDVQRIDIVYVCSNGDIADQNLRKLVVTGDHRPTPATRLTMLVAEHELLRSTATDTAKPVTFVAFTPATSFEFGGRVGKARERAVLFDLLAEHLSLRGADATALKRVLQGNVTSLDRFEYYVASSRESRKGLWEPGIKAAFLVAFDASPARGELESLIEGARYRSALSESQGDHARRLTAALRHLLARASVAALQPDLVILDEFQRFRNLLADDSDAGELAAHLFDQPDARVLLLSATPYKAFTYAEEAAAGDDHYADLVRTLEFLGNGHADVANIKTALADIRRNALAGRPIAAERGLLESSLRRLMCRTERPALGPDGMLAARDHVVDHVEGSDLAAYAALHDVASALQAPLTVEYWKSAPYFGNFLDGYKIGEKLKDAMKDPARRATLAPTVHRLQRIHRRSIESFQHVDWGNARMRQLGRDVIDNGSWKLLWLPPSLPYHGFGGAFAAPEVQRLTKRLIFSSWVAAPTAIASLLSYEVERRIHTAVNRFVNTPEERRAATSRLAPRLDGDRPASMSALSLFWPFPALADVTDPLDAARERGDALVDVQGLLAWARDRVRPLVGESGASAMTASSAWHWAAPLLADGGTPFGSALSQVDPPLLVEAVAGGESDHDEEAAGGGRILAAHVELALRTLAGARPDVDRPGDLLDVVTLLALASPASCAWRSLGRILPPDHRTTPAGRWRAAAVIASGFRTLFNRPEVTYLIDDVERSNEATYAQTVLRYCLHGNLQACLDEYLHHLEDAGSFDVKMDAGLLELAHEARRAITLRPARYVAFDPESEDSSGISFLSRFALRFGNTRQDQEDVRLPEVRAAFNSPFWPFILATTSIGQEGVDFHWWCHAIVHWNLPANPVDFEQREGRVNRFKGHAVRRNIAAKFGRAALSQREEADPWSALYALAHAEREPGETDLVPYWIYPGEARIERHLLCYPLSRDVSRWAELRDVLALYRLAFGQPRQDDMVALLKRRGLSKDEERVSELRLDLSALRAKIAPA